MKTTKTIFRVFPEGDAIALFPNQRGARPAWCNSYQHIGQHGDAHKDLIKELRAATAEEYAPLAAELQRIGYKNIEVIQ